MEKKQYRIWAGEGIIGNIEGYAKTLKGARRRATMASSSGDRWTRIEERLDGKLDSQGNELTGWIDIS